MTHQQQLDTRAVEVATEALTLIRSHEVHCGERWAEARDEQRAARADFKDYKSGQNKKWFWLYTLILGGQGSLLIALLASYILGK
jgi:hypothetical protein